jgi:hypothetical protein
MLLHPRVLILDDHTVDTLIPAGSRTWDVDLLYTISYEDTNIDSSYSDQPE